MLERIADGKDARAAIAAMRELRSVGFADRVESTVTNLTPEAREERVLTLLKTAEERLRADEERQHA
jgi:hypothetical protein